MNQKELRELEARCIQEEPPACTAACPIHVDVRGFLKEAALGRWDAALRILASIMPLPGMVGRICDHPCEAVCRRDEAGDAISISALECATLTYGRRLEARFPLPAKETSVAILGGTLAALTCAWDLVYKGYTVHLFRTTESLARSLGNRYGGVLGQEAIASELEILRSLGLRFDPAPDLSRPGRFDGITRDFDALFLDPDVENLPLKEASPDLFLSCDPLTLATSRPGIFLLNSDGETLLSSPIQLVAAGRKSALSIDRFLQSVSLTAGREREGAYTSKLFTSLAGIQSLARVPMETPPLYSEAEARDEAGRCIQCACMECVKVCLYLDRFTSYPKRYVRQIYNNETILIGSHGQTNRLINSCSLCGLCEVVCPNKVAMAPVCMEGRVNLVKRGKMPPSVHDFALEDMKQANHERSRICAHEPGKDRSSSVFFPGCQMGAHYPDHLRDSYALLRRTMKGPVGLLLRCCGAPAEWAGRFDLFAASLEGLRRDWESLGSPAMIVACPTCQQVFKRHLPGAEIQTLWEVLADSPEALGRAGKHIPEKLALHDPCSARHEPYLQESVRRILTRLGSSVEELDLSRTTTECCGFGGLMAAAHPDLGRDVAHQRASRSDTDYVTYCVVCRSRLASGGKRILHILDLLFGSTPDPATRKVPGLSERHENRYRAKRRLTRELWAGETPLEDHEKISLDISDEVMAIMDARMILTEDVRRTVHHAEESGVRLRNPSNNHFLAWFKPAHVTYWVEYSCESKVPNRHFTVHNAYSHRMDITGDKK